MRKTLLYFWSLVGCPGIFFVSYMWLFDYALKQGKMPFQVLPQAAFYLASAVLILSGAISIAMTTSNRRKSTAFGAAYFVLMGVVLFAISALVSCLNGDCL